jgi:hydrogenase maturation protease
MLQKLQAILEDRLKKILFTGVGNVLRSDDGVGVYICQHIEPAASREILLAETSIENYIGKINRSGADILVLVDCVNFGKDPGYHDLKPVRELLDITFHTHNISLKKVSELFLMPVFILGIQPADTSFGEKLTRPVMDAAKNIIDQINAIPGLTAL